MASLAPPSARAKLSREPFLRRGQSGEAFLLLHGLGGAPYELQPLAEHLHREGSGDTVQAVLYPGHEASAWMPRSSWRAWVDTAKSAYRSLSETHARVWLVGFSTGAPVAAKLSEEVCAERPIDGLILICPFESIRPQPWLTTMSGGALTPERLARAVPDWFPLLRLRSPVRGDPRLAREVRALRGTPNLNVSAVRSALDLIDEVHRSALKSLSAPTLIIQASHDGVVDPRGAERIFETLATPHKALHVIASRSHALGLSPERAQVFQLIDAFRARE